MRQAPSHVESLAPAAGGPASPSAPALPRRRGRSRPWAHGFGNHPVRPWGHPGGRHATRQRALHNRVDRWPCRPRRQIRRGLPGRGPAASPGGQQHEGPGAGSAVGSGPAVGMTRSRTTAGRLRRRRWAASEQVTSRCAPTRPTSRCRAPTARTPAAAPGTSPRSRSGRSQSRL